MEVFVVLGQMFVLFGMMLCGYFVYKIGWMTEDATARLSKLVVNVFNPILVINGVLGQSGTGSFDKIVSNLILVVVYFGILILFSLVLLWILRPKKELRSLYQVMSIFSNLGFMGIPVIRSIYGDEAIIYVAFYILAYNLLVYTYGEYLTRKAAKEAYGDETLRKQNGSGFSLKKMLNAGVVASIVAVLIFASGIKTPEYVNTFCNYMGNTTIPLSMMLIGMSVAKEDLRKMFDDVRIYLFVLIRMVLLPIGLIFAFRNLPIDSVVFGVFIIEFGMPVGSIISLMAKENGADAEYCTKGVVLSTMASIITIPIICGFL